MEGHLKSKSPATVSAFYALVLRHQMRQSMHAEVYINMSSCGYFHKTLFLEKWNDETLAAKWNCVKLVFRGVRIHMAEL